MRFFKKRREKKKHQREVRQIVDEQIEIMVEEMNQFMAHGDGKNMWENITVNYNKIKKQQQIQQTLARWKTGNETDVEYR